MFPRSGNYRPGLLRGQKKAAGQTASRLFTGMELYSTGMEFYSTAESFALLVVMGLPPAVRATPSSLNW